MIRKIKLKDETKILTMWMKANFRVNNFIERDFWLERFNKMKDNIFTYRTYVYEEDNEIKGFISIANNRILAIIVKEEYLNKGIGRKLINNCKERNDTLNMNIYENNTDGLVFMLRMGFKNIGIQVDHSTNQKEYVLEWKNT